MKRLSHTPEDRAIFSHSARIGLINMLSGDRIDMCIMRYNARMANRLGLSAAQRERSELRVALSTRRAPIDNLSATIVNLSRRTA